ncbi:prepilin-type N-terminal cleavage/methylation domain-containing protein [Entomohabitans teleogrylli]|uniref:prepilin-type N-terminal cleavage/methylation domain-containing protein n=1 Tax=Entomohabitans teleogrylli TaxID=1384589 RepID=UPI000AC837B5|nr:prepilin-type N-terminal cleavage/methylation domain-containing protein [Entomohabitans teleogrylli]
MKRQRGFSLPEALVSLVLLVLVASALAGYLSGLQRGAASQRQAQLLWRYVSQQTALSPPPLPEGWSVSRIQSAQGDCRAVSVQVIAPDGRQGQAYRLHCADTP